MRRTSKLTCVAIATVLGGCGNTYEGLSMGDWQEAGVAEAPLSPVKGEFTVTTVTAGEGRIAKAGDLVKAEIIVTTQSVNPSALPRPREAKVVWLWLGRETWPSETRSVADLDTFGDLGSGRTRKALIGRQLRERFRIELEPGAQHSIDEIPLAGIISTSLGMLDGVSYIGKRMVESRDWRSLMLSPSGYGAASAELTILNICDAKLLRRTATLRQKGLILATGDYKYDFSREGTLGWTAIDAQCPAPDGHIRFEAGPAHHPGSLSDRTDLADWHRSYIRLRPAEKFPQEWEPWNPASRQH